MPRNLELDGSSGAAQPSTRSLPPTRMCFVIGQFSAPGGAERVMSILANHWAARGHAIRLIDIAGEGTPFYELDPRIDFCCLRAPGASGGTWKSALGTLQRLTRLRRAILTWRPDIVIAFCGYTNILTLLALLGASTPVIVSERAHPLHYPLSEVHWADKMWRWLRRRLYPHARALVVQTETIGEYFEHHGLQRLAVIANPVQKPAEEALSAGTKPSCMGLPAGPFVLGVGRLCAQKNFPLLIGAFARLAALLPSWSLVILGEGPDRAELERLILRQGLGEHIFLLGAVSLTNQIMRCGQIFVMSSRYEGFPNALCEAMTSGLAVVATDCPGGVRDIVQHGVNGLLVGNDDEEGLVEALASLMGSSALRERLGCRAREISDRFAAERVFADWEQLIEQVLEKNSAKAAGLAGGPHGG